MREYCGRRIRAFHALQREMRPHRPGRDGRILSNNWDGGCGESAAKKFCLTPLHCGGKFSIISTHMNMEEPAVER